MGDQSTGRFFVVHEGCGSTAKIVFHQRAYAYLKEMAPHEQARLTEELVTLWGSAVRKLASVGHCSSWTPDDLGTVLRLASDNVLVSLNGAAANIRLCDRALTLHVHSLYPKTFLTGCKLQKISG